MHSTLHKSTSLQASKQCQISEPILDCYVFPLKILCVKMSKWRLWDKDITLIQFKPVSRVCLWQWGKETHKEHFCIYSAWQGEQRLMAFPAQINKALHFLILLDEILYVSDFHRIAPFTSCTSDLIANLSGHISFYALIDFKADLTMFSI